MGLVQGGLGQGLGGLGAIQQKSKYSEHSMQSGDEGVYEPL
jgi:hypothetical protein